MLSCPMARSKRWRGAMRGGLWSSSSVPAAGICHKRGTVLGVRTRSLAEVAMGVAWTAAAKQPCLELLIWQSDTHQVHLDRCAVIGRRGHDPATSPLSYRQLKPTHGPRRQGWYCRCVVWLNFSSWSMRKTPEGAEGHSAGPAELWGKETRRHAGEDHEGSKAVDSSAR